MEIIIIIGFNTLIEPRILICIFSWFFWLQYFDRLPLKLNTWCGPEAQVSAVSDDIAYFSHDIEDGIRAEFFSVDSILEEFDILKDFRKKLKIL